MNHFKLKRKEFIFTKSREEESEPSPFTSRPLLLLLLTVSIDFAVANTINTIIMKADVLPMVMFTASASHLSGPGRQFPDLWITQVSSLNLKVFLQFFSTLNSRV